MDNVPKLMKNRNQWVNRTGADGKVPCTPFGKLEGWQLPENWSNYEEVASAAPRYGGIGWIVQVDPELGDQQIICIDFDCCRDPSPNGSGPDPWVLKWLDKLQSYSQVSVSGAGYHVWIRGRLPEGMSSAQSSGCNPAESGLSESAWSAIQATKKKKNVPPPTRANRIEIYMGGGIVNGKSIGARHIAMTDDYEAKYGLDLQERQAVLDELLLACATGNNESKVYVNDQLGIDCQYNRKLPKLNILDVIDTQGWEEVGSQLRGAHPTLGSTTGHNVVVRPGENLYAYMHNGLNKGGDAWVWVACEAGAVAWENAGPGCLRSREVVERTVAYALKRGWINEDQVKVSEPGMPSVSLANNVGSIGVDSSDGAIKEVVYKHDPVTKKPVYNNEGELVKELKWISDWAVHVHTETREWRAGKEYTEYLMVGDGAKDHIHREFVVSAATTEMPNGFKPLCENAFGVANHSGREFNWPLVKRLSYYPVKKQRITVPAWKDGIALVEGVNLVPNVEYRMSHLTPAIVYDGDRTLAVEALRKLLNSKKFSKILVTAVLGAPIYARWFKSDRFGVALWGATGSHKTTLAKAACCIYGVGYDEETSMIKHDAQSSTMYARGEAIANAGILVRIIDNVKTVDDRATTQYVSLIQTAMEGGEKLQGKKDKGLREIVPYLATLIITGEVQPAEASTTARVLNLNIIAENEPLYGYGDRMLLPVIGYYWLRYLSGDITQIQKVLDEFPVRKMKEAVEYDKQGAVNSGRLANMSTLLKLTWTILEMSPMGDLFLELHDAFKAELAEAVREQMKAVNGDSDVHSFLAGVARLKASQPDRFMPANGLPAGKEVYGRETDKGLFVLPEMVLTALLHLGFFVQKPNVRSMTNRLHEIGALVMFKDGHYMKKMYRLTMNGELVSGWMLNLNNQRTTDKKAKETQTDISGDRFPKTPNLDDLRAHGIITTTNCPGVSIDDKSKEGREYREIEKYSIITTTTDTDMYGSQKVSQPSLNRSLNLPLTQDIIIKMTELADARRAMKDGRGLTATELMVAMYWLFKDVVSYDECAWYMKEWTLRRMDGIDRASIRIDKQRSD